MASTSNIHGLKYASAWANPRSRRPPAGVIGSHPGIGTASEPVIEPVVRSLAKASVREIKGFEERLAYNLYRLDTKDHARRLTKRASEDPSADGFLYARCGCVANGKRFYDEVRKEPKRFPKDVEFESLLRIAGDAYERKTGDDFDYDTGCSYESFSNVRAWES